jgi:hypothetical protein
VEDVVTWDDIKRMAFEPIARTPLDEAMGRYRYQGPDGTIVTLDTGRGHAERCTYAGSWTCVRGCRAEASR